jgi:hypothetical protein
MANIATALVLPLAPVGESENALQAGDNRLEVLNNQLQRRVVKLCIALGLADNTHNLRLNLTFAIDHVSPPGLARVEVAR